MVVRDAEAGGTLVAVGQNPICLHQHIDFVDINTLVAGEAVVRLNFIILLFSYYCTLIYFVVKSSMNNNTYKFYILGKYIK